MEYPVDSRGTGTPVTCADRPLISKINLRVIVRRLLSLAQLAQALSANGQVIADRHSSSDTVTETAGRVVLVPPALLNRVARYLDAAAVLVRTEGVLPDGFDPTHATQLADTFEADSVTVRYYSDGG